MYTRACDTPSTSAAAGAGGERIQTKSPPPTHGGTRHHRRRLQRRNSGNGTERGGSNSSSTHPPTTTTTTAAAAAATAIATVTTTIVPWGRQAAAAVHAVSVSQSVYVTRLWCACACVIRTLARPSVCEIYAHVFSLLRLTLARVHRFFFQWIFAPKFLWFFPVYPFPTHRVIYNIYLYGVYGHNMTTVYWTSFENWILSLQMALPAGVVYSIHEIYSGKSVIFECIICRYLLCYIFVKKLKNRLRSVIRLLLIKLIVNQPIQNWLVFRKSKLYPTSDELMIWYYCNLPGQLFSYNIVLYYNND